MELLKESYWIICTCVWHMISTPCMLALFYCYYWCCGLRSLIMLGDAQQMGFGSCKQRLQEDPRESRFVFHCCFGNWQCKDTPWVTCCPSLLSAALRKPTWGGKDSFYLYIPITVHHWGKSSRKPTKEPGGRNWCRDLGWVLLTDLLSLTCLA